SIITLSSHASHTDVPANIGHSRRRENLLQSPICLLWRVYHHIRQPPGNSPSSRSTVRLTPRPSIVSPRISPHSSPMVYPRS
ncbi:hypothetical protein CORC01_06398, partial [Colletotrichum orchidophilum]